MTERDGTETPGGETSPTRRGLLNAAAVALPAGIAAAVGVPGAAYLLTPVLREGSETWVELGPVGPLREAPSPLEVRFHYETRVGYVQGRRSALLLVVPDADDTDGVRVLSAVCTHKACNVTWAEDEGLFACPCHRGRFDAKGAPVAGPPSEPLVRLPAEVRDGVLFARIAEGQA